MGLAGVWTAMCIELCVRGALFLLRLWRGNWMARGALG
jgi:Na+-driven multidrug efflux pump